MQDNKHYYPISREDLQRFLNHFEKTCREYTHKEYQIDKKLLKEQGLRDNTEIQEYCYVLKIDEQNCLKIYTSFDRRWERIRAKDTDAIRIVGADRYTFQPILDKFPHTKRLPHWEDNLMNKIMNALYQLGYNIILKNCGHEGILRENHKESKLFLGCSKFREHKCKNSEPLSIDHKSQAPKEREIFNRKRSY